MDTGQAEHVIQRVAGCGRFQAVLVAVHLCLHKIPTFAVILLMSFGNYNPGWRCLDNGTVPADTNGTVVSAQTNGSAEYVVGTCDAYRSCDRVEFNPSASTILTEWGLVCDRAWIASVITSVQMAGVMVGSFASGQLGDSFGRKRISYGSLFVCIVLNFVSIYSVSWQMFAVFRFILGVAIACTFSQMFVLTSEYMTLKWRAIIAPIPAYHLGGVIFAVTAMYLPDWKYLHLSTAVWCIIAFVPIFWVPESLRWLEVKNKKSEFAKVAQKIVRMNGKEIAVDDDVKLKVKVPGTNQETKQTNYTFLDLFRKGYRLYAVLIAIVWFAVSLIFYAISLGAKDLYGDFFINLILLNAIEIPVATVPMMAPNLIGRKKSGCVFFVLATLGLVMSTAFILWAPYDVKSTGSMVLTVFSKVSVNAAWYTFYNHTVEIYPTVVRSLSLGWGSTMARVGGMIAPFVLQSDRENLYIFYLVMAVVGLVGSVSVMYLPETKGKPLKETFEDKENERTEVDVEVHLM